MTTGNTNLAGPHEIAGTGRRFVDTTLELIVEEGGSLGVNLRQVSRRMGCAHTNVYNYFGSYQDLLWAAFRRAIRLYGDALIDGLSVDMSAVDYLERVVHNLAAFPQAHPGLYRFIGSDPIDTDDLPADILESVSAMKRWFASVVESAAGPDTTRKDAGSTADIVLAYIDGEMLNLINGRAIPGEDLDGRVVANAMRLFELLVERGARRRGRARRVAGTPPDPVLIFGIGGD